MEQQKRIRLAGLTIAQYDAILNHCNSNIFVFDRAKDSIPQVRFPEECWHCDSCVIDCPKGAITLRMPLSYTLLHVNADTLGREVNR